MGNQTDMLHVRIDPDTKAKAQQALAAMGLTMADAVRLFLTRLVADQAFPFDLKVPNAATRAAMQEAEDMLKTGSARFSTIDELTGDLEKNLR